MSEITNSETFDVLEHINQGYVFTPDDAGVNVRMPSGAHGHGPTAEDAVKNVGARAQFNPATSKNQPRRVDGTWLDERGAPV